MKVLKFEIFLILALIWCPLMAGAVTNQAIGYQGFLIGKTDNLPVNSAKDITFAFYNVDVGGTSIFSESRCNVPVLNGRYEVEIGSSTGGIPDSLFLENSNVWLEIQIDPNDDCAGTYEALQPRIRMQSSPYSFNSLYASTASAATPVFKVDVIEALAETTYGAVTISSNLFVQGGISVGNISPGQKLAVAGIVESSTGGFKFPDGSVQIKAAAETRWSLNIEELYSINLGNMGINTGPNPRAKLHVSSGAGEAGNIFIVSTGPAGSDTDIFRVTGESKVYADSFYGDGFNLANVFGTDITRLLKTGDTMAGNLTILGSSVTILNSNTFVMNSLEITTDTSKSVYHFVVSTSGNVGIGLNNPQYKLHISSPDGGIGVLLAVSTGTTNVFEITGNGDVTAAKFYGDGSGLTDVVSSDSSRVLKSGDTMTGQLTIAASSLTVAGDGGFSGSLYAASSITANGGIFGSTLTVEAANIEYGVTASSGTFTVWGLNQYSIETTSGIKVNYGVVDAPYFLGDGSGLQNVLGVDSTRVLKSGDNMTGSLGLLNNSTLTVTGNAFSVGVSTFIVKNGYVGVGILNPVEKFHVNADTLIGANLSSPAFYISAANQGVGVATTTISHKLSVAGGIMATSSITANGGFYGDIMTSSITLAGTLGIGVSETIAKLEVKENGDEKYTVIIGTYLAGGYQHTYDMVITTQGKVGIGVDEPTQNLHIGGSMRIGHENEPAPAFVHFRAGGGDTYIRWEEASSQNKGILGFIGGQKDLIFRTNSGSLSSGGIEAFMVKNNGNFGIGVNPGYRLHVSSGSGEAGDILVVSTGATNVFRVTGESRVYADYFHGSGSNLTGIVTESLDHLISGKLTFTDDLTLSGSTLTVTGNAFSVGISTLVVNSGKVGIGLIAPSKELQTVGEIRVSTSATSSAHLNMAGAVDSLPTTGYDEGVMIYLTTDHTLYISTETVATDTSWKAVW